MLYLINYYFASQRNGPEHVKLWLNVNFCCVQCTVICTSPELSSVVQYFKLFIAETVFLSKLNFVHVHTGSSFKCSFYPFWDKLWTLITEVNVTFCEAMEDKHLAVSDLSAI